MVRRAFLFCAVVFSVALLGAQEPVVTLTPAVVVAGAPELIHVHAAGGALPTGEWLGQSLAFFPGMHAGDFFALAGVDVETRPGASKLTLHVSAAGEVTRTVEIHAARYRTGSLTVSPKFVEPDPEAQKQIAAEAELKKQVFSASAPQPLWSGSFRAPLATAATDSFGTRRMFNGKLASVHKGADFHAGTGTPVHASNAGVVVIARPLYFEGNCVVIDHGMSLYSLSMHFSRIDVHEGDRVRTGQVIGLSGATGRVTGPHLHWAVRWHNAYLDPVKLLKLNLNGLR